jgi:hypothetical protein
VPLRTGTRATLAASTRYLPGSLHDLPVELAPLRARVAQEIDRQRCRHDSVDVESGIDPARCLQAAHEEARGDQQQHGQSHFGHDEHLLQAHTAAGHDAVGSVLEGGHDVRLRRPARRQGSKDDAREHRESKRERQHAAIDREIDQKRKCARRWRHGGNPAGHCPDQSETEQPADGRQEHALGQQLPEQPSGARAEREPHGDLAPAGDGPRQEHVGDVGACNEQHRTDDTPKQERHRPQDLPLRRIPLVHGQHRDADRTGTGTSGPGVRHLDRDQIGSSLFRSHASLEAGDAGEPAVGAMVEQVGIHLARVAGTRRTHDGLHHHRDVETSLPTDLRPAKRRRCHADDGERVPVQKDVVSDNVGSSSEARLPESVADHHHRVRADRPVISR